MTCKWPECDGNHARCALLACLAQVPLIDDERMERGQWAWSHQYACGRWKEGTERNRRQLAESVAGRLLAWLRSPRWDHPIDRTPLNGVRPVQLQNIDRPVTDPEHWTTDWPAVAVVADYLSTCGGWLWVHEFRPLRPLHEERPVGSRHRSADILAYRPGE